MHYLLTFYENSDELGLKITSVAPVDLLVDGNSKMTQVWDLDRY